MDPITVPIATEAGLSTGTAAIGAVVASLALGIVVVGALLFRWGRLRTLRREAIRAEAAGHGPLRPGWTTILGRVEGEARTPLVLRVVETGKEVTNEGSTSSTWTEVRRSLEVRPFQIRVASGETVDVEPDQRTTLIHELETVERPSRDERVREARLHAAELVRVCGLLSAPPTSSGAYRAGAGAERWTLRPGHRGLVVSREPLGEAIGRGAGAFLIAAALSGLTLVLGHASAAGSYHRLALDGYASEAVVDALETGVDHGKDGEVTWYQVVVSSDGTAPYRASLPRSDWRRLAVGDVVPIWRTTDGTCVQIGGAPGVRVDLLVFFTALSAMIAGCVAAWHAMRRPWWEKRPIVSHESGPL